MANIEDKPQIDWDAIDLMLMVLMRTTLS